MPLPSQNDRTPELGRAYVLKSNRARRPGFSPAWLLGAAGVVALGVGGYLMFGRSGPETADAAGTEKLVSAEKPAGERSLKSEPRIPTKGNTPAPKSLADGLAKKDPPPVVLNQGSTGDRGAGSAPLPGATPDTPALGGGAGGAGAGEKTAGSTPGDGKPSSPDLTKPQQGVPSGGGAPDRGTSGTPGAEAPAPVTPPPEPKVSTPLSASGSTRAVREKIDEGDAALSKGELVRARTILSGALTSPEVSGLDADFLRSKLTSINDELVFSPKIVAGDPLAESYTVQPGDRLATIVKQNALAVDWRFVQRLNKISNPGALRVGQKLKLVRGPFHAIVTKKDYRLDLYAGAPDEPDRWLFIRSFKVGLGTENGTPVGTFVVRSNSKLIDPHWVNPKTGEKFANSDPKNPIGEYWIGLDGVGESAVHTGYGIHGTIEPDSIGRQMSMGCVRMLADDIALVYEVLMEKASVVKIVP